MRSRSNPTSLDNNEPGLRPNIGPRRWSLTVGETPDGVFQPTGLVSDDGKIIQHGMWADIVLTQADQDLQVQVNISDLPQLLAQVHRVPRD